MTRAHNLFSKVTSSPVQYERAHSTPFISESRPKS
ncbi:hypothetical protein FOPG_19435 [Fusarium oxysporum f. sp. conglutinans race 2 54008]|uniref:Uncharacterized protein n=1 Tax=Fusarium oxysporum f. sp. conglutinans race 2 54008 TaxID=1089457 RepID=X0HT20_FUSOX|nr:hypothetical protein FOPG_19435 [Fusarium oxysporum f. sp. conglutinans race 2 54008]